MQASLPSVSVCIPVYNRARLVAEALDSVLAQGYPRLEILVQDNASTDGTAAVLAQYAQAHPHIRVERNPALISMSANYNAVLNRAQGEAVLPLSSDDLLEPGFLRTCADALADPALDLVTTGYYWLEDGRKTRRIPKVRGGLYRGALRTILLENPFNVNCTLFRRAALDRARIGGKVLRERLVTADFDLWLRLAAAGCTMLYLDGLNGGSYRLHAGNVTKSNRTMYRHAGLTILANRAALKAQCPLAYRYKLGRMLTHDLRDWLRGRPLDRQLTRAVRLALLERQAVSAGCGSG